MRFPLLWIAAAFSAGVYSGSGKISPSFLLFIVVGVLLLVALLLCRKRRFRTAWCSSLAAWVGLGIACACLESISLPATHVTRLFAGGRITAQDTLRWRGQLRNNPLAMPNGIRYEIDLEQVELSGRPQPVAGGLRVTYFLNTEQPETPPATKAGDSIEVLVRARPPRNFLTPGAFDARGQLARQGTHLTGTLRSFELLRSYPAPSLDFAHRAARFRGDLLQRIEMLFQGEPDHAAVLRAILLGDYNFIDHELAETFQKTSAYHVLVISGLHVAALAAFVFWMGRRLRLSAALSSLLTVAVLFAFVAIVENRPPIQRAALMTVIVLVAGLLFRKTQLLNTVGVAVLVVLAMQPTALFDPSFQLSFLAGLMIGALGLPLLEISSAPLRDALRHISDVTRDARYAPRMAQFRLDIRALRSALAARAPAGSSTFLAEAAVLPLRALLWTWDVLVISTVIQIGMLPVLAGYFHRISWIGPLANIPAAALSAALIPLGLVTLALGSAWTAAGEMLAWLTSLITELLLRSVGWFAQWHGLSYRIPGPPLWLAGGFFVLLAAIAGLLHEKRQAAAGPAAWLAFALLIPTWAIATFPFAANLPTGRMEATVLDVGQGDSIFLSFPQGRTMLVDGGGQFGTARARGFRNNPDLGEQVVSPYLWSRGVKQIDVVALSHGHQDHLEGLISVLENFAVGELWLGREIRSEAFARLLKKAAERNVRVVYRHRGDSFQFDPVAGLVLWPEPLPPAMNATNNDSLVIRLDFDERAFLLAGDIEADVERELFERDDPLSADFLKVPHHGSRTSTTTNFALAVLPKVAVMSLSEANPFGHPHGQVIETLGALAADSYRTDRDGATTVSTDGKSLRVTSFSRKQYRCEW